MNNTTNHTTNHTNMVRNEDTNDQQKEECTRHLKEWLSLDDERAALQKQARSIRQKQNELEHRIIFYMQQHNSDEIKFDGGSIKCATKTVKSSLSNKSLKNTLSQYFENNQDKTDTLLQYIQENREETQKVALKRFVEKTNVGKK